MPTFVVNHRTYFQNQLMKITTYSFVSALLLAIVFGSCGKTPITNAYSNKYNPKPCAKYHHGSVIYTNTTKHTMIVYCQAMHQDLPLAPYTSQEIHQVPSGKYYVRYDFVGKKKKGNEGPVQVTDCLAKKLLLK